MRGDLIGLHRRPILEAMVFPLAWYTKWRFHFWRVIGGEGKNSFVRDFLQPFLLNKSPRISEFNILQTWYYNTYNFKTNSETKELQIVIQRNLIFVFSSMIWSIGYFENLQASFLMAQWSRRLATIS